MKRIKTIPRINYKQKLEELSFEFHSLDGVYWDESAYYELNNQDVSRLEEATNELWHNCLDAVQHVIDNELYDKLHIDQRLIPLIERSWNEEEPSIYGRFDLAYDGKGSPKLLEFNADTPTSLYEAAVVQWYWLQEVAKDKDQFNSIHERLIDYWKGCKDYFGGEFIHFSCIDSIEDFTTTEYLRDTANQAGLNTAFLHMHEIGWNGANFTDLNEAPILNLFKLYPWEWLMGEEFGKYIGADAVKSRWIEPAWKAILSNKGILPILYELNPHSRFILPAYFDTPNGLTAYAKKPIYSREGSNIKLIDGGAVVEETDGEYGEEGFIYQQKAKLFTSDNNYTVVGSWVIDGEAAGIGLRESNTPITNNTSRFIPHLIN